MIICSGLPGSTIQHVLGRRELARSDLVSQRLRAVARENAELKRLVGDLTLDNRMLKDVLGKKW
jgi:hypothetical protein